MDCDDATAADDVQELQALHERDGGTGHDFRLAMRTAMAYGPAFAGRTAFCKPLDRDAETHSLRLAGLVVVELEGIGPSARGRLGDVLDDALERELAARGASGPGLTSASERDAALSDQLFRARRLGAAGMAIVLGPLRAAANALGALEPEDCATLRFLADATRERPLVVLLDERDARTGGYAEPIPLAQLLESPLPVNAPVNVPVHAPVNVPAYAIPSRPREP